jgi:type I restriction enzyme, S subunit
MKERLMAPELRFNGFTDDWELRKIEDILKNIKGSMKIGPFGSALKKEYYVEKGIKVYAQENIFKNDFSLGNYYITEDKYLELQSCELIPGDIVISMMGTIGACSVFPETSEKGIMNSHLLRLQTNDSSLAEYIALQIKDSPFIKQQILKLSVGSIMSGLSSTVVKKLKFPIPSIEEQRKIYLFFKQLDDTITLHQRKVDLLKEQKKGYLQKMFPKTGEKIPELRFGGFTEAWEERKLSEIATMNARIGWQNLRTSEFLDSGDYMLITGTDFKDGKIDYSHIHYVEKERYDQDKKIQIKNDSILITKDGTLGKVAYVEDLNMPATLNAGVFNVRVKESELVDSQYLFHYLKAPFLLKYAAEQSTGGTIKHLNQNVLVDFPIPLPIKSEQQKIGSFFKQLDDTIALHQRKLDLLKEQKKSYLQKMFI